MIVNYLQTKNPDFKEIEKILEPSINSNIWSNNGPVKQQLEKYLEDLLNLNDDKCVICTNSGTSSMQLLLMYYEFKCNKELRWASSSYTFPSALVNNFKTVDVLDINLETFNVPLTDGYDGYIVTNLFGTYPKDIEEFTNYCKEENKILIFDNASSPLSTVNGINICNLGDACIGSLHCTKYLGGASEGGFIVVNREEYDLVNSLTNFGFYNSRKYNKFSSNYKMPEISAAIHLEHLRKYDIERHIYNQSTFIEEIDKLDNVQMFNYNDGVVYGNLALLFNSEIDNKDFKDIGINANKYYLPLNLNHKNSFVLYNRIINIALNSSLTSYQIDFIIKQIKIKSNG